MINTDTTVRELVVQYPQTQKVFEKHGIDYCCGGRKPLAEAASSSGVKVEALIPELESAMAEPQPETALERNWNTADLTELIEHIVEKHHAYLKAEAPRLQPILEKVAHVHGPSHGDVLVPLLQEFLKMKAEIEVHMKKEEEILFPYIKELEACGKQNGGKPAASLNLVNVLAETVEEHEAVGAILAEMRELTSGYHLPEDACPTYGAAYYGLMEIEDDLHQHIHLENNILFPRAAGMDAAA